MVRGGVTRGEGWGGSGGGGDGGEGREGGVDTQTTQSRQSCPHRASRSILDAEVGEMCTFCGYLLQDNTCKFCGLRIKYKIH